ncbi:MAG TPA: TolC family protein [Gemmatimonadales bacterium]
MKAAAARWWSGLALTALAVGPAWSQSRVTLDEAISRARRVQPVVIQAEGQVRNAEARVRSARGAFLPNLTLSGNGQSFFSEQNRVDPLTGLPVLSGETSQSASGSLSTSIELWDGLRRPNELKSARASTEAAEANLRDASFQQALTTTNQFLDALAARKLLAVREASVRRAEEQLKTSVARLQAGAAIRSDSLRSLVGVGNAQLQLLTTQAQLATAEANLGRLIGESGRVEAADDSAFYRVITAVDADQLLAEAVARSPQVEAADASLRSAGAALSASRSPYWPSLNLSASTSLNGNEASDWRFRQQRQLTLGLQWSIFNRFTREQSIATNQVNVDIARATLEESRRGVVADLTQRVAELEAARLRIDITQRSVVAAQEDLRVQQDRYRLGVSTILDVLTTTEALDQAEVDVVNARFDYLRAKAAIEAIIGRSL